MFEAYKELLQKIDDTCADILLARKDEIQCRKGCSWCCRHISVFPVEAFHIHETLAGISPDIFDRILQNAENPPEGDGCPFLVEDACAVYEARPVICRTQGMPLLTRIQGEKTITCCPKNFKETTSFPAKFIIDLERLNQLLVAINRLFLESAERQGLPDRISLADIIIRRWQQHPS